MNATKINAVDVSWEQDVFVDAEQLWHNFYPCDALLAQSLLSKRVRHTPVFYQNR